MNNLSGTMYMVVSRRSYPQKKGEELVGRRVTASEPTTLQPGEVAIKFRMEVPVAAFRPLEATDLVVVPEENVITEARVDVD